MDERIARLKTPHDARRFAENARRLGHPELEVQALQRMRELRAIEEGFTSPAEQAIAIALYAYEEEQSRVKGRTSPAHRTRQMFKRHGVLAAAERMVLSRRPSTGFEVLEDAGLQELSFEAIVVRFPDEFSADAVAAAHARLEGRPPPPRSASPASVLGPSPEGQPTTEPSRIELTPEAMNFFSGFRAPDAWFQDKWMPRYRATIQAIADALSAGRPEDVFDVLWKTVDNAISHAGQGVLKFDLVDEMRPELLQVIRDIAADPTPGNFERIVERFEGWKAQGRVSMVPRLLIARAFAGIHPQHYHTTVDAPSQEGVLQWFVENTGFVLPRFRGWADRAQALVGHMERAGVHEDALARNLFPWFVIEQMRSRSASNDIPPGHTPRAAEAFVDLPPQRRAIVLRHNAVQTALYDTLVETFGRDNVWTEYPTGTGGYADAIARRPDGRRELYEIKIAATAGEVVRQAMGQLLEYGFRVGGLEPAKLIVVGEPDLDAHTSDFLARLRSEFKMEIDYLRVAAAEPPWSPPTGEVSAG
ncbi:hypothetical protein [Dokdonella sp.]|uniref:hypothetical protein n=1 Tax=Dokdonella sp. TaxID=2291710 RepID=UPI00378333DB